MRTKPILTIIVVSLCWLYSSGLAQDNQEYLDLEIKFRESNPALNIAPQTVLCDTVRIIKGDQMEAFVGNLSLFLQYNLHFDSVAEFEVTQISLAPQSQTIYKRVRTPLGAPYAVENVLAKGEHIYSAVFTPLRFGKTSITCEYDHRDQEQFYADPSGSFDIYFVPNSLADIHWNNIRDYLEIELDKFNQIFTFSQPGKINYYLYPCQAYTYADYINGSFGIHPAKNAIYHEYSHHTAGLPAYAVNLLKLYRYWGYAPHILAEGIANLGEFYGFYCREYKKSEGLSPLRDLLISIDYDNQKNKFKRQMQAAALAGYLIGKYGKDKVHNLYDISTDLNLEQNLLDLTGINIDELDRELNTYIDTITYPIGLHHYYAQREMAQSNAAEAIYLYEKGKESDPADTTFDSHLFNAYYIIGDYDKAIDIIKQMSTYFPENRYCLQLANMMFSDGQVDSALHYYHIAENLGLDRELVSYKLGQINYYLEDYHTSLKYFQFIADSSESIPLQIDAHLYIGQIYLSDKMKDTADLHFTMALNGSKKLISIAQDNPLYNLRAGEAALMLREFESAGQYLDYAEFIELRPFYLGRILLAKGMLADLLKDRENAKIYYQRVLENKSSFIDKTSAQTYLKHSFQL